MENLDFEAASKFVLLWENSSFGRALGVLSALAEREAKRTEPVTKALEQRPEPFDPLLKPQEAAKYLGVSWKTIRDNYIGLYGIKTSGTNRSRRIALSELNRVRAIREEQAQHGKSVPDSRKVAN